MDLKATCQQAARKIPYSDLKSQQLEAMLECSGCFCGLANEIWEEPYLYHSAFGVHSLLANSVIVDSPTTIMKDQAQCLQ